MLAMEAQTEEQKTSCLNAPTGNLLITTAKLAMLISEHCILASSAIVSYLVARDEVTVPFSAKSLTPHMPTCSDLP